MAMLSEQYRMDPAISAFPAAFFYGQQLLDHASVKQRAADTPLPDRGYCQALAFFDCRCGQACEPALAVIIICIIFTILVVIGMTIVSPAHRHRHLRHHYPHPAAHDGTSSPAVHRQCWPQLQ